MALSSLSGIAMSILTIVLSASIILFLAYRIYGRILANLLELDATRVTPAQQLRDDVDYAPIEAKFLLSQHFSAIAAAGPIVGPILAGLAFGWLPALLWILVGSIFIGGVHDMTSLVASIRHNAQSIAEIVREHMSVRSYTLFLAFIWLALVYIVVAFTDITSQAFVGQQVLENGETVLGGGIATSSLLYLALPMIMGVLLRFTNLSLPVATLIFVPLTGVVIWIGQYIPLDLATVYSPYVASDQRAQELAQHTWSVFLLLYCFAAAVAPMWLLLQPRGHLGGYFLFFTLGGTVLGIVLGNRTIEYPAFIGWEGTKLGSLFPFLFITIACGACSGFHSLIASGTTSKQLKRETDARVIGYGTMLLEGLTAVLSLVCVMMISRNSPLVQSPPNAIYAAGVGSLLSTFGVPAAFAVSFALMAFTTFVYDTLDVCTRLGRYIVQELTGWNGAAGRWFATGITALAPLVFLLRPTVYLDGKPVRIWQAFWPLFGASNQLLAALTLLSVTVWLWRTRRATWVWFVTGIPTVWMYVVSVWALAS
jgi:carbon starvation protein